MATTQRLPTVDRSGRAHAACHQAAFRLGGRSWPERRPCEALRSHEFTEAVRAAPVTAFPRSELTVPIQTRHLTARIDGRKAAIGEGSRGWLNQRRQPLHELQRAHDPLRGRAAPGRLEIGFHLAGSVELHSLVLQRLPGDVAAELLERLAFVGPTACGCVQAETLHVRAQVLPEVRLPGHGALHRQHLMPSS
jgi:hypothetical protein